MIYIYVCEVCIRILSNLPFVCRCFNSQWRDDCAIAAYDFATLLGKVWWPFEAVARWGLCGPFTFVSSHW